MTGVTTDGTRTTRARPEDRRVERRWPESPSAPVTWRTLGLETMASLLVVSLGRESSRSFVAHCQWPRCHPLNERTTAVRHHPLIMVESARQLALAVERTHLYADERPALEPLSLSLGLRPPPGPTEHGSATDVEARLVLSDLASYAGQFASYRATTEFLQRGTPFASCTIGFARPLEGGTPIPDEAVAHALLFPSAAAVGAAADTDVLLARAPQGRLVLHPRDPGHPVLLPGRPAWLPAAAVLEAGRQATLLHSGMTAGAVTGLGVRLLAPVPARGAVVEVATEPGGSRFLVTAAGRVVATGTVALLQP
ncbi:MULTISPECIES: hypothetical protein [Streptomyces]